MVKRLKKWEWYTYHLFISIYGDILGMVDLLLFYHVLPTLFHSHSPPSHGSAGSPVALGLRIQRRQVGLRLLHHLRQAALHGAHARRELLQPRQHLPPVRPRRKGTLGKWFHGKKNGKESGYRPSFF